MSNVPVAVPVAVRLALAAACERREDFASAWPAALAAALDGRARWDAEAWQNCLTETVDSWRSAFECRGAGPLATALGVLGDDREMRAVLEVEYAAARCRVMVVKRRAGGVRATCSDRCRRRAEVEAAEREAVAV